jgi:hypothetical protein
LNIDGEIFDNHIPTEAEISKLYRHRGPLLLVRRTLFFQQLLLLNMNLIYKSSIDAVKELILVAESDGFVSYISNKDSRLMNGINYCLVEVTCRSGAMYIIHAYGDEALKLYCEAKTLMRTKHC